ncbi:ATP-dependent zinc metalloprotease FTSH 5, mitochondrial [Hordeum vulgare]|nr:ATP-dependent zinc metalloprotease FTSH 5, mitochondrial [Hordeum vulgare]
MLLPPPPLDLSSPFGRPPASSTSPPPPRPPPAAPPRPQTTGRLLQRAACRAPPTIDSGLLPPSRLPQPEMKVNTDDMESLSVDSGWSSSDGSDIEELLQDDDVEMMSLLLDVQEFEDRAKLMDQRRGSKMGRVTIYRNRGLRHEQLMQDYFAEVDERGDVDDAPTMMNAR